MPPKVSRAEHRLLRLKALQEKAEKARQDGFSSCICENGLPCTGLMRTIPEERIGRRFCPALVFCAHGFGEAVVKNPAQAFGCTRRVEPKKLPHPS